jgi:hypothetical protein
MERSAALPLVSRIEATWSTGHPWSGQRCDEWIDALLTLDAGSAGTAFARLRLTHADCPSIATFVQTVKALHTTDASNRPKECGWCDDSGWTETPRHTARGVVYTGWEPCTHCSEGREREVSETWTKSPPRTFVTDPEAERLVAAGKERTR